MSIEFQGLDSILDNLEELADINRFEAAMMRACALVEREAKIKAQDLGGEGLLASTIKSKVEKDNTDIKGIVYTPLEYAPYVEYGTGLFAENGGRTDVPWSYQDDKGDWHTTSGMKPQPYMRPALDENRTQILRILKEGLKND